MRLRLDFTLNSHLVPFPPLDRILGCVKLTLPSPGVGEVGMLAVAEDARRRGLGKALMDAAEARAVANKCTRLQLQLLHPKDFKHPVKEFLKGWYAARGFRVIDKLDFGEHSADMARLLAGPVHFDLYEKPLM